ncbi:MAG TPA: Cna B-type domain-containing protein, partial [Erysipelothrix sp.]|nr:Cna B-type domain-containing protein [Erysipelothrix sp.]
MKKIFLSFVILALTLISTTNANAQYSDFNLEVDLISNSNNLLSGQQNSLNLKVKSTGAKTVFTNVELAVVFENHEFVEIDVDSLESAIVGKFDRYDVVDGKVVLYAEKFESGKFYDLSIIYKTINGLTPHGSKLSVNWTFKSDQLQKNGENPLDIIIEASSPLKINKDYLGMTPEGQESQGLYYGATSYWLTRALIDYEKIGQEFIKENTKIIVTETYNENLVYSGMHEGPEPIIDSVNRVLRWEFDAPTYVEQKNSTTSLWSRDLIVKYDTVTEPQNSVVVKDVGTLVELEFENISDELNKDESSKHVTLYPGKADIPNLKGSWNVFGHWGPLDGFGNHGYASVADMNQQPTVYPWATLTFGHRISAMYSGKLDGYKTYMYNYLIDDYLELEKLHLPSEWVDFPDTTNGSSPLIDYPEYDIYFLNKKVDLDINGNNAIAEEDIIAKLTYGVDFEHGEDITRELILSKKGLDDSTHIAQVRYDFTYAPAGLFSMSGVEGKNMFLYDFKISDKWAHSSKYDVDNDTTKFVNDITIYAEPVDNPKFMKEGIAAELWDFRKSTIDGENKCAGHPNPDSNQGWWTDGNGIVGSCMYITRSVNGNTGPNGFGQSLFWDVNASRSAYVTSDPLENEPTVSNKIKLQNQVNGKIVPGSNKLEIHVENHKDVSIGSIEKGGINSYIMIPNSITVDTNSLQAKDSDGNLVSVNISKLPITSGNYSFYKVKWNTGYIVPDSRLELSADVIISDEYQDLNMHIFTDLINNKNFTVLKSVIPSITDTIIVKDSFALTDKGINHNLIKSSNSYHMISDYFVDTKKLVKGSLDKEFSSSGYTTLDEEVAYKLQIINKEGRDIESFVLMDVLPSIEDKGITDGVNRGSEFGLVLNKPVSVDEKFEVLYSTSKNPRRDLLNEVLDTSGFDLITNPDTSEEPNWLGEEDVLDWESIHSFAIVLKEGQILSPDEMTEINFTTVIDPLDKQVLSESTMMFVAWNSFALAINGKPTVEPLQVRVTLQEETPVEESTTFTVTKKWVNAPKDKPAVTVQLLQNGNVYETIILDGKEEWTYTWLNLPLKNDNNEEYTYTVREIDVPINYTAMIDGSVITNTYEEPQPEKPVDKTPPTGVSDKMLMYLNVLLISCII